MNTWRIASLGREALANLLSGGARSILLIIGLVIGIGGPGLTEAFIVGDLIEREADAAERGAYVLVVRPNPTDVAGISATGCESLNAQGGVVRAGGIIDNDLVETPTAKGTRVRRLLVTAGFLETIGIVSSEATPMIVVGASLFDELGIGVGSYVNAAPSEIDSLYPVDFRADSDRVLASIDRSIVVVMPTEARTAVTACYVAVEPPFYESLAGGAVLGLADLSDRTPGVADVLPRGSGEGLGDSFRDRQTRYGGFAGAAVAITVMYVVAHARRSEFALYLTTGTKRADLRTLLAGEALLALLIGAVLVLVTFLLAVKLWNIPRAAIVFGLHAMGSAICVILAASLLAAWLMARTRGTFDHLKDR